MTRLLIYSSDVARVSKDLVAHGSALDILRMDDAGLVTHDGAALEAGKSLPDIGWLSGEVFARGALRAFASELFKAPNLRWVQSAAAGFDHSLFANLINKGAKLTTSHVHSEPIADYVLAGVLDYLQRGPDRRNAQARAAWEVLKFREVAETHWLVVGFGSIGQAVARRARAFGARIIGVRRTLDPHPLADVLVSPQDLRHELPRADVVVLSTPLTASTRHLADAGFFSAMKSGSVLVNVGRGALVNEADLLAALGRGLPAHAILDVFETEPLASDSPFWGHPRVSLTAHAASETDAVDTRNAALFLDNLQRYVTGKPLLNLADPRDVLGV